MVIKVIRRDGTEYYSCDRINVFNAFDGSEVVDLQDGDVPVGATSVPEMSPETSCVECVNGKDINAIFFQPEDIVYLMNDSGKTIERIWSVMSKSQHNREIKLVH